MLSVRAMGQIIISSSNFVEAAVAQVQRQPYRRKNVYCMFLFHCFVYHKIGDSRILGNFKEKLCKGVIYRDCTVHLGQLICARENI